MEQESLEIRGKRAAEKIAEILKAENLSMSVDIHMLQDFVNSLKPTLIDATPKENDK